MNEFKPTHRYNGQDEICFFAAGTKVEYVGECQIGDEAYNATIGVYRAEDGVLQDVRRSCMEAI